MRSTPPIDLQRTPWIVQYCKSQTLQMEQSEIQEELARTHTHEATINHRARDRKVPFTFD